MTSSKNHTQYAIIPSECEIYTVNGKSSLFRYNYSIFSLMAFFKTSFLCPMHLMTLELVRFLALVLIYRLQMHATQIWIHTQIFRIRMMVATMQAHPAFLAITISQLQNMRCIR